MQKSDSDSPHGIKDRLGRDNLADSCARLLVDSAPKESLVVGIEGPWGSGKTWFAEKLIDSYARKKPCLIIRFDPWICSSASELIRFFLKQFYLSLRAPDFRYGDMPKGFLARLKMWWGFHWKIWKFEWAFKPLVSSVGVSVAGNGGNISWENDEARNLYKQKEALQKLLKDIPFKIIIHIDDLDRLPAKQINALFALIRSIGDLNNTIYLLCIDRQVVAESLKKEFQLERGEDYMQKLIQLSLPLPMMKFEDKEKWFGDLMQEFGINGDSMDKNERYRWWKISELAKRIFFRNPRSFSLFRNHFIARRNFLEIEDINTVDLFTLSALAVFAPDIHYMIKDRLDVFVNHSSFAGGETDPGKRSAWWNSQKEEFSKKYGADMLSLLDNLFPGLSVYPKSLDDSYIETLWVEKRAASLECSDRYFTYDLALNEISQREIKSAKEFFLSDENGSNLDVDAIYQNQGKWLGFLVNVKAAIRSDLSPDDGKRLIGGILTYLDSNISRQTGFGSREDHRIGDLFDALNHKGNITSNNIVAETFSVIKTLFDRLENPYYIWMKKHSLRREDGYMNFEKQFDEFLIGKIKAYAASEKLLNHPALFQFVTDWHLIDKNDASRDPNNPTDAQEYIKKICQSREGLFKWLDVSTQKGYDSEIGETTFINKQLDMLLLEPSSIDEQLTRYNDTEGGLTMNELRIREIWDNSSKDTSTNRRLSKQ